MAAKEILLFSSSQSRDISLYPSGNSYTLFLSSPVRNIERVDLVSARVPTSVSEQIFLDIDELRTPRHVFTGGLQYEKRGSYVTQLTSGAGPSRAFAPLTLDVNSGCIKNFHENKDYKISVFYPEPINKLQRLTVSWLDINGQPLAFNDLEQNSFILRLHVRATVTGPTEEENELERRVAELEIKRFIEDVSEPPPPPTTKTRFGKWTVILLALLGVLGYVVYKRFLRPNPEFPNL